MYITLMTLVGTLIVAKFRQIFCLLFYFYWLKVNVIWERDGNVDWKNVALSVPVSFGYLTISVLFGYTSKLKQKSMLLHVLQSSLYLIPKLRDHGIKQCREELAF